MSKIAIIGGSGFIGSALITKLKETHLIQNLDKKNLSDFPTSLIDVRDINSLDLIDPETDWVILLAAEHTDNVTPVSLYYDVNVQGTKNVLEAMDRKGIKKIMFTSSVAIYGLNKENPLETSPVDPFNDYGISKWNAEKELNNWYQKNPLTRTLVIIRPTVVFGEGNRGNVYNLLKQIKSGKFMMIGKGENKKSMSYVGNIVSFMKYAIEHLQNGHHIYNYADKPDLSTSELVQIIQKKLDMKKGFVKIPYLVGYLGGMAFDVIAIITGKKFSISRIRIKKFCATTQFSADKVTNTGFLPPFTLKEGLERTIESI